MTIDIQEDVLESLKSTLENADFKKALKIINDNKIDTNSLGNKKISFIYLNKEFSTNLTTILILLRGP